MILYLKHIAIEGPGIAQDLIQKNVGTGRDLSLHNILELQNGDSLPEDFSNIKAVIILGGPMNVYEEDKHPFLKKEDDFIKEIMHREIPLLGICLGSQLIAKACGAKVRKSPVKEVGWRKVVLTEEGRRDPIFKNVGTVSLQVFQWHEDTFEIPKGGILLSTSKDCSNQAFRIGKNTYGLQFHIEVTDNIIESWIKEYFKVSDAWEDKRTREMLEAYQTIKDQFNQQAECIFRNFAKVIKSRGRWPSAPTYKYFHSQLK